MTFIKYLICFLLPTLCSSLFLDQIGKFDWKTRYLGCPHQTWFGRIRTQDVLIVLSDSDVIARVDLSNGEIVWRQFNEKKPLKLLSVDESAVVLEINKKQRAFDPHTGAFLWDKSKGENTKEKQFDEKGLIDSKINANSNELEILLKHQSSIKVKFPRVETAASIKDVKVLPSYIEGEYKILVTRKDCSLEFFEFTQSNNSLKRLWNRQESLAMISDVLMVDLPLSESQAQIESEFNQDESILRSFLLRIRSQLEQLHRFIFKTSLNIVETIDLLLRGKIAYSTLLKHFFNHVEERQNMPIERDYFNLRKMIVVSTLAGTLHGLDSTNGRLIWTYQLGEQFSAYKGVKAPLFLLRGTSFYQWASKAAVVFNSKSSKDSMILIFNPITGEKDDQINISGGISRVELWPFPSVEQLHPLLILRNLQPSKAELFPPTDVPAQDQKPVFISIVDSEKGTMIGNEIRLNDKFGQVIERWRLTLPGFEDSKMAGKETVEIVKGKGISEKVHSQGRVLGDRSVLYKYSNPNLIAILSSNRADSILHLHLIDSVSGHLVYSGRYLRAQPPFHMVHCENWIVLSYWNDKARRTEIGVIELFEGPRQENSTSFNSFTMTSKHLFAIAQTFIFPQGISALSSTDTMQGLTSRSILMALSNGGILEMSRRFLDARRPLEMTQEHREEMLVPYMPELPLITEDLLSYNQTIMNVRQVLSTPSGLESSALVFAFGVDLFYTRAMPSGTFDILKDDFGYAFIFLVMVFLTVASYICKRISRHQSIQRAWE